MRLSENLTPDGRPIFSMGGKESYQTFNHRGYVVSLEWVGTGTRAATCLVIWPERTNLADDVETGAWCISRRAIGEFVGFNSQGKCTGEATAHCIQEARQALPVLGKDQSDEQALSALVEAVVKFAPELMLMPAKPQPANEQAFSEAF